MVFSTTFTILKPVIMIIWCLQLVSQPYKIYVCAWVMSVTGLIYKQVKFERDRSGTIEGMSLQDTFLTILLEELYRSDSGTIEGMSLQDTFLTILLEELY